MRLLMRNLLESSPQSPSRKLERYSPSGDTRVIRNKKISQGIRPRSLFQPFVVGIRRKKLSGKDAMVRRYRRVLLRFIAG